MIKVKTEKELIKEFDLKQFIKEQNLKFLKIDGNNFKILSIENDTINVEQNKFKAFW